MINKHVSWAVLNGIFICMQMLNILDSLCPLCAYCFFIWMLQRVRVVKLFVCDLV